MKIKLLSAALGVALSVAAMSASAQKEYKSGTISFTTNMRGMDIQMKEYFTPDSMATAFTAGPANIKLLTDANYKSFVVLVDVSAFNVKKAAVYTPDEIDQVVGSFPTFT